MAGGVEYSKGAHLTIKNKHVADIFLLKREQRREDNEDVFLFPILFAIYFLYRQLWSVGIARVNV